jgi:hypothetical protein
VASIHRVFVCHKANQNDPGGMLRSLVECEICQIRFPGFVALRLVDGLAQPVLLHSTDIHRPTAPHRGRRPCCQRAGSNRREVP